MTVNLQKTQYISSLSGFKNKFGYNVTNATPGYSLGAGQFVAITTTLTFINPGAVIGDISSVQIKLDGLETFWRNLEGMFWVEFPDSTTPTYEVGALTFFTPTTHSVYVYIANETGGTINIPAFTIRYRLNTYDAPF